MSFLHGLRLRFYKYKFEKALQKPQPKRVSTDFKKAVTVGLLFDATELSNREIAEKFARDLEKKGKKVKLLGFLKTKEETDNMAFANFNLKNIDFSLIPSKSEEVKEFMKKDFDVLINLSLDEIEPLEYISAFSHAKFRVGPYTEKTACYDLMIDVSKKKTTEEFIRQTLFFLEKMN